MASATVIFWVIAAVLIGFVGFFILLLAGAFKLLRFVLRQLLWEFSGDRTEVYSDVGAPAMKCPRAGCGHVNNSVARYCGRCGQRLEH